MADVKKINGYNVKDEVARQMRGVVLWTNSSPNSDFVAKTISLSLSAYDAVEVYCSGTLSGFTKVLKGYSSQLVALTGSDSKPQYGCMGAWRTVTMSASGVTFDNCKLIYTSSVPTVSNSYLKPYKIVGYKFS